MHRGRLNACKKDAMLNNARWSHAGGPGIAWRSALPLSTNSKQTGRVIQITLLTSRPLYACQPTLLDTVLAAAMVAETYFPTVCRSITSVQHAQRSCS